MGLEELFADEHKPLGVDKALIEADRCLDCGGPLTPPPCVAACPACIDVPKFIGEIREGRTLEAGATIFASNILGGTCSRVCPVEELCEGACVQAREGRGPVPIGLLQRLATDAWLSADPAVRQSSLTTKFERPKTRLSVGVIGAGPAGLSCAAELARLGHVVTVYEQRKFAGGLVTTAIAPYKQRYEPIPQEVEAIRALGVQLCFGEHIDAQRLKALEEHHDVLFLGIGLGADYQADLPGEDLKGVWDSLPFIERVKRGVFPDLSGTRLAVIGGGNTAIDVAREAVRLGAEEVTMIYRRTQAQMPAYAHEYRAAVEEGVKFMWLTAPVRFVGDWSVRAVECLRMELRGTDSSGRPRPEPIPDSEFLVPANLVVKAIGQQPHENLLKLLGIETRKGLVVVDENNRTSQARRFAGGDCINGGGTVVQAVQHGKRAAYAIHEQCANTPGLSAAKPWSAPRWRTGVTEHVSVGVEQYNGVVRHYQGDFAILTRASHCKGCPLCVNSCPVGALEIDHTDHVHMTDISKCIFCGLCEDRCPDFAIWVERTGGRRARNDHTRGVHEPQLSQMECQ